MSDWRIDKARFVFNRDASNGMLVGPDGCHYDTEAQAMYFNLGLCGCGNPEEVHKLLIDCLSQFVMPEGDWSKRGGMETIEAIVKARPEIAAEFVAHFLSQAHLTEHGGSVGGSWLTDRGKQFLEVGVLADDVND